MTDFVVHKIVSALATLHLGETACNERAIKHKIKSFVDAGKPIPFLLLAFPGKSINPNSVSGYLPDLGESLALGNLRNLIDEVGHIYEPGMILHILSDGHFFMPAGIIRQPAELDAYIGALKEMKESERIIVHTIHDLYAEGELSEKLANFERQYMPSPEEVHQALSSHRFYAWEYPNKIAFAYHEFCPVLYPELVGKGRQAAAKMMARALIGCQIAVGRLAGEHFKHCVRLSIHCQHDPTAEKYYIDLLPQVEGKGTPWFHVVAEEEGKLRLAKRSEVIRQLVAHDHGIVELA